MPHPQCRGSAIHAPAHPCGPTMLEQLWSNYETQTKLRQQYPLLLKQRVESESHRSCHPKHLEIHNPTTKEVKR